MTEFTKWYKQQDPETKAIIDIIHPFANREKLRNHSELETRKYVDQLVSKCFVEVFGE